MEYTFPVIEVLPPEWHIEAVSMPQRLDISGGCALAKHLLNRITWDEMNQHEDDGNDEPDDRERVQQPRNDLARHAEDVFSQFGPQQQSTLFAVTVVGRLRSVACYRPREGSPGMDYYLGTVADEVGVSPGIGFGGRGSIRTEATRFPSMFSTTKRRAS